MDFGLVGEPMNELTNENKMQLETAHFAPGAATWRTGRNVRAVFDFDLYSINYIM